MLYSIFMSAVSSMAIWRNSIRLQPRTVTFWQSTESWTLTLKTNRLVTRSLQSFLCTVLWMMHWACWVMARKIHRLWLPCETEQMCGLEIRGAPYPLWTMSDLIGKEMLANIGTLLLQRLPSMIYPPFFNLFKSKLALKRLVTWVILWEPPHSL